MLLDKMPYQQKKSNQLYWLKMMDIDYYCCPDSKLIDDIKASNQKYIALTVNFKKNINKPVLTEKILTLPEEEKMTDDVMETRTLADKASNLAELKNIVLAYEGCAIKKFSHNTVFADGNPEAKIMLIGEAPGATEDQKGIPFCGESGKLLDNMLATIGLCRETNAYITNTVFWRPPANRPPTQTEIDLCRPFVEKHIAIIKPKLIILVGSTAATSLLGKHAGITKIRQEHFSYINKYLESPIALTAIFHPAYLLRQPMQKKTSWYDLLKIQQFIEEQRIF